MGLCFSYWILALFIASTGYFDLVFIKLFPPSSDNQGTVWIIHQSQNFLLVLKFQDSWMIVIFSLTTTFISTGAIEMSLTILNWPQLFRCSFSRRIKFHTNLLTNKNILVGKVNLMFENTWTLQELAAHMQYLQREDLWTIKSILDERLNIKNDSSGLLYGKIDLLRGRSCAILE